MPTPTTMPMALMLVLAAIPRAIADDDSKPTFGPRVRPWARVEPGFVMVPGPDGRLYPQAVPVIMVGPRLSPYPPILLAPAIQPVAEPAPIAAPAPAVAPAPVVAPRPIAAPIRKVDDDRVKRLTTYGDNSFRGGNRDRARLRYRQAIAADPSRPGPRIGLAQIALAEGDYREAAHCFREALAADRDYLDHPEDVEQLWGEAADFDRAVSRLETYVQAHPQDRDAWLVLGAEWFLSRRARPAADIFLRLSDRPGDPALNAFLRATSR